MSTYYHITTEAYADGDDDIREDAVLIADMYEALRLMVWRYEDTENMDDEDYPELAAARAALAKAEGR